MPKRTVGLSRACGLVMYHTRTIIGPTITKTVYREKREGLSKVYGNEEEPFSESCSDIACENHSHILVVLCTLVAVGCKDLRHLIRNLRAIFSVYNVCHRNRTEQSFGPEANLNGEESIGVITSDGELQ